MTQAKTAESQRLKIYVQKCPPFTRTHAFKPLCHCAIAAAMTVCMVQQPPLPQQTFFQLLHVMDPRVVDPLLKHIPDAVVHRIQIWRIRWPHLWRDKLWRLSLQHGDMCHVHDVLVPYLGNLAEKRSNFRKQSGYPAEAYL